MFEKKLGSCQQPASSLYHDGAVHTISKITCLYECTMTTMTDTQEAKTPDEQRRSRKHTTYQQHKARAKVAERKEEPLLDAQQELSRSRSESPLFSPISKRSISARRKEIIQKRNRKKADEQVEAVQKESEKLDSSWLNASMEESMNDNNNNDEAVERGTSEEFIDEIRDKHLLPEPDTSNVHHDSNGSLEESFELADRDETNVHLGVREAPTDETFCTMNKRSWDTTSIMEHPAAPEPLVDPSKVHLDSNVSLEKSIERSDTRDESNIKLGVREESMDENVGGSITEKCPPQSDEAVSEDLLGDVDVTDKRPPMSDEAANENLEELEGSTGQDVLVGGEATDNCRLLSDEANEDLGERVESMGEDVLVGGEVTDNRPPLLSDEANVELGQREESMGEDVGGVVTDKRPPLSDEADEKLGRREQSTG
jgi:hypothetical protein